MVSGATTGVSAGTATDAAIDNKIRTRTFKLLPPDWLGMEPECSSLSGSGVPSNLKAWRNPGGFAEFSPQAGASPRQFDTPPDVASVTLGGMSHEIEQGPGAPAKRAGCIALLVALVVLLIGARSLASYAIEVAWWKELGQLRTWWSMLYYSVAPVALATLVAFAALWLTHARALKFAHTSLSQHRLYARLSTLELLLLAYLVAVSAIDTWTVVRYAGSTGAAVASGWHDPIFDKPLVFYLFDLPFYGMLRSYVLAVVIVCILLYWLAARGWQLRFQLTQTQQDVREINPAMFRLEGGLESRFLRGAAVVLLIALAVRFFLGRYEMVYNEHGTFLVGVDYVDQKIGLPLQWLLIFACFAAAGLLLMGRWIMAAFMSGALVIAFVAPRAVSALYVRPNEISLERPYIQAHIDATRSAYGLKQSVQEIEFKADPDAPIDTVHHKALLDNVRLWDLQADVVEQRFVVDRVDGSVGIGFEFDFLDALLQTVGAAGGIDVRLDVRPLQ